LALANAQPIRAAEPFVDFTFKRIKPTANTGGKRITIQILPDTTPAPDQDAPTAQPPPNMQNWFWAKIAPGMTESGPGRFTKAVEVIRTASQVSNDFTPSLQVLHGLAARYGKDILLATLGSDLSPAFVLALISVEPEGEAPNRSGDGADKAVHLSANQFQSLPSPGAESNSAILTATVNYMQTLMDKYDRDPILALAAYHSGAEQIAAYQGVPPTAGVRTYVPRVIATWQVARTLCKTPPELFSDGCVFDVKETP